MAVNKKNLLLFFLLFNAIWSLELAQWPVGLAEESHELTVVQSSDWYVGKWTCLTVLDQLLRVVAD